MLDVPERASAKDSFGACKLSSKVRGETGNSGSIPSVEQRNTWPAVAEMLFFGFFIG